tara:strand:- start:2867 stop:3202 length:336 start_codon:yes stop_codon:yes gene_type:complete
MTMKTRRQPYNASQAAYWARLDAHRDLEGKYPAWAFDFISVHQRRPDGDFCLVGPLSLQQVSADRWRLSKRCRFESLRFDTRKAAKEYARRVVSMVAKIGQAVHVVNCCDV